MNFIAYTNELSPTLLQGKGLGVKIEPIDLTLFKKELNYHTFRGAYITGKAEKQLIFLKEQILPILMESVHVFNTRVFTWYDIHKVVYYCELYPNSFEPAAFYRITCNEPILKDDNDNYIVTAFVHPSETN